MTLDDDSATKIAAPLPLASFLINIEPEIPAGGNGDSTFCDEEQESGAPSLPLEDVRQDFELKEIRLRLISIEQRNTEATDNHNIRKKHAGWLFGLTVCWIAIVWLVVLMQGFNRFPIPLFPSMYKNLSFKLSDSVVMAFMTSTTATVLGLYGIAAYWLFGNNEKKAKKIKKDKGKK